uniref:LysR substrate-binding domain-containing protein n=2 Tax=Vibrio ordalii TaxID=28174 RepID=UPI0025710C6A
IGVMTRFFAPQLRSTVAMAQAGFGIAIVPKSLAEHIDDSATIASLEGMPFSSQIALVWEASNLNKQVAKMVKALCIKK